MLDRQVKQVRPPTTVLDYPVLAAYYCAHCFWIRSVQAIPGDSGYSVSKNPPRSRNKNVLESKHGVIRTVFLRLLNEKEDNAGLVAMQAVRISNDFYGSDILLSFEMAKGFTKLVSKSATVH